MQHIREPASLLERGRTRRLQCFHSKWSLAERYTREMNTVQSKKEKCARKRERKQEMMGFKWEIIPNTVLQMSFQRSYNVHFTSGLSFSRCKWIMHLRGQQTMATILMVFTITVCLLQHPCLSAKAWLVGLHTKISKCSFVAPYVPYQNTSCTFIIGTFLYLLACRGVK